MARSIKLLGFVLYSALLVPAMPIAGEAFQNAGRLRGVGDRFLNGSGTGDPVTRQEPVPLSATQIPGFLGAGDPLRVDTTPAPWELDLLTEEGPQAEPLPLLIEPPQVLAQANNRQSEANRLLQQGFQQFNLSQFQEAIISWERALDLYRAAGNRQGEVNALENLGVAHNSLGQYRSAIEIFEQLLSVFRELGNLAGEGRALGSLGLAYFSLGQYEQAIEFHEQDIEIAREIGNRIGEGHALGNLGIVYRNLGQYERAVDLYEQALEIAREIGDRPGEGRALGNLGLVYANLGQYERAIALYEQRLEIAREIGDRTGEGRALGNLGIVYRNLGQYERAIALYEQRLEIAREIGDRTGEGRALGNLGIVYRNLGQYERAIALYEQRLEIAQEIGDRAGEGAALGGLGSTYFSLGKYERAIALYEQALEIAREIGDRAGEGTTLGNLGNVYANLGKYERAIALYEQALEIAREIGDRAGEGRALGNLGVVYDSLGQYERAIDLYEQHLAITREIGDRAGEGAALGNLGVVYDRLGQYDRAIDLYEQALEIAREIGDRAGEGRTLGNLGNAYFNLGQDDRALEQYSQAVALLNELGTRTEEAVYLSNIGILLNRQAQPELAIIFLKASVDVREEIRGDITGLSTDLQQSFADTVAADYRLLADLLLQQNRIIEAQRVLDLLKVQELDDYLNNIQRTAGTASGVEYLEAEQAILERYDALQTRAIALGLERAELAAKNARDALTPSETARLQELIQLEQALAAEFNSFADSDAVLTLLDRLSVRTIRQTVGLEELSALRNQLDDLDAALIYPLILDDRLELIITTADTEPLRRTIPVGRVDLNAAITDFRQVLEDPSQDPLPAAQQLYRWLIEPLEADLAAAGVTNLIYAPDSSLRYVPLAALHDGDQWLVEKGYRINHITAASLQELTAQPPTEPRILAGAFADEGTVHTVGETQLRGLYYAGEEVSQLQATLPNLQALFDRAFSLAAVTTELGSVNILHFATHAVFLTGDPSESFILFGNGEAPTLRDIGTWSLSGIDLVVLSACETGLGGFDNNGEQILGLGYQFQQRGAKAVVASLWRVSDPGTHALMTGFYGGLDQGQTKAEALRAAQVALITDQSVTTGGPLRAGARPTAEDGRVLGANALPGYSHPYYWAPFILIGNGL
jgi:CHAT domain-containing protein/Tfp pilus assembly protein PilF